jgi:hypothetical protein
VDLLQQLWETPLEPLPVLPEKIEHDSNMPLKKN